METVDKIIEFAEIIAKEDQLKMEAYDNWITFITPLYEKKYHQEFFPHHVDMLTQDRQKWVKGKHLEFLNGLLTLN